MASSLVHSAFYKDPRPVRPRIAHGSRPASCRQGRSQPVHPDQLWTMSASIHIPSRASSLRATPSRTHSCVASRSSESAPLARPSAASSRPAPHPDSARIQSKPPSVRGRKQPHCDPLASAAATTPARSLLRSYDRNQASGTMKLRQSSILSAAAASMTPSNGVKRWDGSGRRSTPWDGLRRVSYSLPALSCLVCLRRPDTH